MSTDYYSFAAVQETKKTSQFGKFEGRITYVITAESVVQQPQITLTNFDRHPEHHVSDRQTNNTSVYVRQALALFLPLFETFSLFLYDVARNSNTINYTSAGE